MGSEPKHIKPFTEAESPIPLVPTDEAWQHMQQKLDEQLPGKRNGSFFAGWKGWIIAVAILAGLAVYYFLFQPADNIPVGRDEEPAQQENNRQQDDLKKSNTTTLSAADTTAGRESKGDKAIPRQHPGIRTEEADTPGAIPHVDQLTPATGKSSDLQPQANQLENVNLHKAAPGKTTAIKKEQPAGNATSLTGGKIRASEGRNRSVPGRQTSNDGLIRSNKTVSQKNIVAGKAEVDNDVPGAAKSDPGISNRDITGDEVVKHPATKYSVVQQTDLTPDPFVTLDIAALTAGRNAIMDSAGGERSSKNKRMVLQAGLQWEIPAPLHNSGRYFTGPDGGSQPYRLLIPAAWITLQKNRHRITLDVSALQSIILSENIYDARNDTMNSYTKSILKTFGYGGGLHYSYSFFRYWRAGAGLQGLLLQKALARNIIDSFGAHIDDTLTLSRSHNDWKKLTPFRLNAGAELWFQQPRWEAGLRIGIPVTRPFKDAGIHTRNNIQAALLLRWRIL